MKKYLQVTYFVPFLCALPVTVCALTLGVILCLERLGLSTLALGHTGFVASILAVLFGALLLFVALPTALIHMLRERGGTGGFAYRFAPLFAVLFGHVLPLALVCFFLWWTLRAAV